MTTHEKPVRARMRRWMAVLAFATLLASCKSEVDIYADYKEVPIVYGLLDAEADTNFVKITRAFYAMGDATQIAMNPDSSDYPGRLDVRLTEFRNGQLTREIVLDTITISNKQQGVFYAPKQKLYFTAEPLRKNDENTRYSYRLTIVLPNDTLVEQCDVVGSDNFKVQSLALNFSKEYFGIRQKFLFRPAVNASVYQIRMAFTFKEQRTPDADSVPRTMEWDLGEYYEYDLSTHMDGNCYSFYYRPESFYEALGNFISGDTAIPGLRRFIGDYPVELEIVAGGEKLHQYIYYNAPENMSTAGNDEFSLIGGGYGVFSSRMTRRTKLRLGGQTVPDLLAMTNWGFKFIGGEKEQSTTEN